MVYDVIRGLQTEQERTQSLMNLKRLAPFLVSIEQFGELCADIDIFHNLPRVMAYIWVSLLFGKKLSLSLQI